MSATISMTNTWYTLTELATQYQQQEEFIKKFKNTILGIKHNERTTPFFALFLTYKPKIGFKFKDQYNNNIILKEETAAQVFIPILNKGYYQGKNNNLYYITKTAQRQWLRGIHEHNTALVHIQQIYDYKNHDNCSYTEAIFNILSWQEHNKDINIKITPEFISDLYNTHFKCINRDFIICLSLYQPTGFDLFFHHHFVGHLEQEDNKLTLQITNPHFKQEIIDSLDSWGPTLSINTI